MLVLPIHKTFRIIATKPLRHASAPSATYKLHDHLNKFVCLRRASTANTTGVDGNVEEPRADSSANVEIEYPFPKHAHPTPYEIFHLKPGALPREVKSRYYQLVRIYHPDAPHARRLPSHVSHARFQAIQAAHDVLIGKLRRNDFLSTNSHMGPRGHTSRRYGRTHDHHAEWAEAAAEAEEYPDERRGDLKIVFGAIAVIGLAAIPFFTIVSSDSKHKTAVQNLAQARREAREHGLERRRQIRKRVRGQELEEEYEDRLLSGSRDRTNGS